jgi:TonB family protein
MISGADEKMKRQTEHMLTLVSLLVVPPTMLLAQAGLVGSSEQRAMYVCSKAHSQPCAEPPRGTYTPDPEYPEEAKNTGLAGRVVLWTIITEEGKAANIRVSTSAGHGFDQAAIGGVRRWKFDPGTYEGKPVPVMINVEVNFKPY